MIHVLISALCKLFVCVFLPFSFFMLFFSLIYFLTGLLPELSTPSRIDPFCFQAGGCRRRPNLALVLFLLISCCIFRCGCMFPFVVFVFVFQY